MTLKFPLINLISRGHLPLTNKTACLNFAKNTEDRIANRICFEMMKCDDVYDAAKFLEEAVECYRDNAEGSRAYFAESTSFADARNMILMRESKVRNDINDAQQATCEKLVNIAKVGGSGAAVAYILKLSPRERETIMHNLKLYNGSIYKQIQDSFAGRALKLPTDPTFFKRLYNTVKGSADKTSGLTDIEIRKFKNFRNAVTKNAGIGLAIATGMVAAIASISMIYKKYFSAEAKACKAFGGKERTVCMTKARIKACDAAINASKKALLECGSAKNEEDCIFKMKVEIRSWTKKKALEEEKLRKLTNVNSSSFEEDKRKTDPFA